MRRSATSGESSVGDTESDSDDDPLIGATVGGYEVRSLLGVGGMGRVYEAIAGDGAAVALKLVREDLAQDSVFRRRFEREAQTAQRIVNPHVVPVLDTGEHAGVPYLAQRFIQGGTLAERLDRERRLAIGVSLGICANVADGLDALFAAGLVHRDVKPANVLLELDGNAYIADFGLAKDNDATNLTRTGQALGSLDYMAPEQIRGQEVDASTDVYALGCVVFHCLSGKPPFGDRQGMRVLWAQLQDEPADPCAELPAASPALGPAVLRALEKDPAARPQSAGEYARLLYEAAGLPAPGQD
jgi:serine/threonine protein kinase